MFWTLVFYSQQFLSTALHRFQALLCWFMDSLQNLRDATVDYHNLNHDTRFVLVLYLGGQVQS